MNKIYLKQEVDPEAIKSGKVKGIAYSGAVIKNHGWLKNLVIDLATLSVAKPKTPLLRDHNTAQIAGIVQVGVDASKEVSFEGTISKKSTHGLEIMDLSEDGFPWEVSMGIFDGEIEEFEDGHYNGQDIPYGNVLKNGVIREISLLALGADGNTSAEVFEVKKLTKTDEVKMNLAITKEDWAKFACGCGGSAESKPEDLKANFDAKEEDIAAKQKEIDDLKAKLAEAQDALDKLKGEEETSARANDLKLAAADKNFDLTDAIVKTAAATVEGTTLLKQVIEAAPKKIAADMAEKVELGTGESLTVSESEVFDRATKLAEELKIPFAEALLKLEVK